MVLHPRSCIRAPDNELDWHDFDKCSYSGFLHSRVLNHNKCLHWCKECERLACGASSCIWFSSETACDEGHSASCASEHNGWPAVGTFTSHRWGNNCRDAFHCARVRGTNL